MAIKDRTHGQDIIDAEFGVGAGVLNVKVGLTPLLDVVEDCEIEQTAGVATPMLEVADGVPPSVLFDVEKSILTSGQELAHLWYAPIWLCPQNSSAQEDTHLRLVHGISLESHKV